jgi:hypothetical protein
MILSVETFMMGCAVVDLSGQATLPYLQFTHLSYCDGA